MRVQRISLAIILAVIAAVPAFAASGKRPAPTGAWAGAPAEYTRFTAAELSRGFLALAFGSDLRLGTKSNNIRRFDTAVRLHLVAGGNDARTQTYRRIAGEFAQKIPNLNMRLVDDLSSANVVVRLIDEKDFFAAMEAAYGRETARSFVAQTDPQCMTSLKSQADGKAVRADVFIIVDQGDEVFFDCAYHETLHAFGLSNHDDRNAWTTLNQKRTVGYLSVYDRAMLTLLYDPRIQPGMTASQVRRILPHAIKDLHLDLRLGPRLAD